MPGIYFKKVIIDNAFCFHPKQVLSFVNTDNKWSKWTIILGENGTGKTTLLQLLATMEMQIVGVNGKGESDFTPTSDHFHSNGRFEGANANVYFELLQEGLIPLPPIKIQFIGYKVFGQPVLHDSRFGEIKCYGYGATRVMGPPTLSDDDLTVNSGTLFYDNLPLVNAEEWFMRLDYSAKSASLSESKAFFEKRRELVKSILIKLLPDVEDIQLVEPAMDTSRPALKFKTFTGWVSLEDLSLGYRTMLTWTVDLAYRLFARYPNSENPLAEPAIVLVDEIDLHLHPKWQREIFGYLSDIFLQTQFVVTAHSPLIVQSLPGDANLVLLKRDKDRVVIDQTLENVRYWRIDQILSSELFDVPVRNQEVETSLERRRLLTAKKDRTPAEELELQSLQKFADSLPYAESESDRRAMEIIRKAADYLQQQEDIAPHLK